ncbi:MAG TPA: hypothetical protein VGG08_09640 [Solirubrobacteraceae bacterium]|jgi:hypothetical protein
MRVSRLPTGRATKALAAGLTLFALTSAAPAQADVGETIILRCTHRESLSGFTQAQYRKALRELGADTEEYSDCSSLIRRAQVAAASHGGGSGSAGSGGGEVSATPIEATPEETQALADASRVRPGALTVGDRSIRPGVIRASDVGTMPTPLLATIAFMLAGLLGLGWRRLRNILRGGSTA